MEHSCERCNQIINSWQSRWRNKDPSHMPSCCRSCSHGDTDEHSVLGQAPVRVSLGRVSDLPSIQITSSVAAALIRSPLFCSQEGKQNFLTGSTKAWCSLTQRLLVSRSVEPSGSSSGWQSPFTLLETSVLGTCFMAVGDELRTFSVNPWTCPCQEDALVGRCLLFLLHMTTSRAPGCWSRLHTGTLLCPARARGAVGTSSRTAQHQRVKPELLPEKCNLTNASFLTFCVSWLD